ncbi:MAG TPA: hypothetical protein VM223_18950 [Planctomycetota bacterium]|nr:hypothetical protein [Planctomycetota bacterium]
MRGGSWNNNPRNCRSANRNRNTPDNRNNNNGFRLALHFRAPHKRREARNCLRPHEAAAHGPGR